MRRIIALSMMVVLTACGPSGDGTGSTSVESTTSSGPDSSSVPATTEASLPNESDAITAAKQDLIGRLQIDESAIEVLEVRVVQWPDGSLGCPQEGMLYTQAIVDGGQVILGVDERVYDYRIDDRGNATLCPSDDKDGGHDFVPPPGFND